MVRNAVGCKIPVRSEWDLDKFEDFLSDYEDKEVITYLRYGWPVGCVDSGVQSLPQNHKGALQNKEQVRNYLDTQAKKGSLIALDNNPFGDRARFSPINTRDKRDNPEEKRIIVDLSSPRGYSINDGTPKEFFLDKEQELHFPTIDSLVEIIRNKGAGCLLYKVDRKSAYKFECLDPGDVHLMGMKFEDKFYFDATLVMGARHAAGCCHRTTSALMFIHQQNGYSGTCFIDDMAGGETPDRAQEAFLSLRDLLRQLCVKEAFDKACSPAPIMIFLGILFNTILMTMEVTPDRLKEIKAEIIRWGSKEYATLKQVQSLVGKLNFCASTVRAGRLFFSRILTYMKEMSARGFSRIPPEVRLDLNWWRRFMNQFNGVTCIPDIVWTRPGLQFSTDASLKMAGGWSPATVNNGGVNEFFSVPFPNFVLDRDDVSINELEALVILIAIRVWGKNCKGKRVLIQCDNAATVQIVNSGRAANKFAQACMREIHYWCAVHDCQVRTIHVPSEQNQMADLASRMYSRKHKAEFDILTKYMQVSEVQVPNNYFVFLNNW